MKTGNFHFSPGTSRHLLVHCCCWTAFIGYELGALYFGAGGLRDAVIVYVFYYALNITVFYSHYALLNAVFGRRTISYVQGLAVFLMMIFGYFLFKIAFSFLVQTAQSTFLNYLHGFLRYVLPSLLRLGYFILLATLYWVASHISVYRERALEAEKVQLQANQEKAELAMRLAVSQNAYLEQQLNPHLLFNSLNFIYTSVYPHSQEAAESVLLLADIMRFGLDGADDDGKVLLADELEQVERLLAINHSRFTGSPAIAFLVEGAITGWRIIPLVLFTLTENMFKHGNLHDPARPAVLSLRVSPNGLLNFHTCNPKKTGAAGQRRKSLGLQHTRTRLEFAYPGKYQLETNDGHTFFELHLTLQL